MRASTKVGESSFLVSLGRNETTSFLIQNGITPPLLRLSAKGKKDKVALIAVGNKRLKQAFASIKSGVPCQADFTSKLTCNA